MYKKIIASIIFQAALAGLALVLILEFLARTPWAERHFPYRSFANYHYQFEIKWFKLQEYVRQNGGVDVILLGSSLVNTGLDPQVISQAYFERTGQQLRIFNFGVEGLTIAPQSVIGRILVDAYHPALLVYVTEMREYVAGSGVKLETEFLSNPWMRYRQGFVDPLGWLEDHSRLMQDLLPWRNWMREDFPNSIYMFITRSANTTSSGYEPENAVGVDLDYPPEPGDPAEAKTFALLSNYQVTPERLDDLRTLLALGSTNNTRILVVEMPVHPTYYVYAGGEQVHQAFQAAIAATVTFAGGMFIPAEACPGIPVEGRANRWHLNKVGVPFFSSCVGGQLADRAGDLGLNRLPVR
jgi:hypothetical protein